LKPGVGVLHRFVEAPEKEMEVIAAFEFDIEMTLRADESSKVWPCSLGQPVEKFENESIHPHLCNPVTIWVPIGQCYEVLWFVLF
jgi:hypothetical protein